MALKAKIKGVSFGIGDVIRVTQRIKEGEKIRTHDFEGIVISIKGRDRNASFTLRRIGIQKVGIERIFPVYTPTIEKIKVIRKGTKGTRRAKLYFIRKKSKKEIEKIYSRSKKKESKIYKKKTSKSRSSK